jgi:hypothetical protein
LKSAGSTPPNCYDCPKPWHSFPSICQWCGIFLFTIIWGERWLLVLLIFVELLVISVLTLLQNCTMFKSGIPISCKENLILERKNMDANEHDYPNLHFSAVFLCCSFSSSSSSSSFSSSSQYRVNSSTSVETPAHDGWTAENHQSMYN